MDEHSQESLNQMYLEIVRLLDDSSNASFKVAAVSALEVLSERFPSNNSIFSVCLGPVTRCITSRNTVVTSSCLRTIAALINILGPKALAELPQIMGNVVKSSGRVLSHFVITPKTNDVLSTSNESHLFSVLITLEAVVDKLGVFLNPYLTNIMELLVLHPEYLSEIYAKVESRAQGVRKLLAVKVPVRLAMPHLLKLYPAAVVAGDNSLTVLFDMSATLVATMDRSSIVAFHGIFFDFCLVALDLRHRSPLSVQNIDVVEKSVMNAMIALTLKLTESMFKLLFIKSIEWAESEVDETASAGSIDRAISFYGMIIICSILQTLGSCVHHLSDGGDVKVSGLSRRKKKAKIQTLPL